MKTKLLPTLGNLRQIHEGKTRRTYEIGDPELLLVVTTDRLSTHNVVHRSEIPLKGEVLTALTIFWLNQVLGTKFNHHLVAFGKAIYSYLPDDVAYPADLHHRAIIVRKLEMIPVEFIYRVYLTGSLWKSYERGEPNPYGLSLPEGLRQMSKFEEPLFTPTDKSATDDPLNTSDTVTNHVLAYQLALEAFNLARKHLNSVGIELVDSKFEIGKDPMSRATIADEFATPDSSRFCEMSQISEGVEPAWLDKQLARNAAEEIWGAGKKVPLEFGQELVDTMSATYLQIFERITGMSLDAYQRLHMS